MDLQFCILFSERVLIQLYRYNIVILIGPVKHFRRASRRVLCSTPIEFFAAALRAALLIYYSIFSVALRGVCCLLL